MLGSFRQGRFAESFRGYVVARAISPQDALSRICDHRLRAIRAWLESGEHDADEKAQYLLQDLRKNVTAYTPASLYRERAHVWFYDLSTLIDDIDLADQTRMKIRQIYDHIDREYPTIVLRGSIRGWYTQSRSSEDSSSWY
jgi:hypothetical protein